MILCPSSSDSKVVLYFTVTDIEKATKVSMSDTLLLTNRSGTGSRGVLDRFLAMEIMIAMSTRTMRA